MPVKSADIYWLAGLLEGEGSFFCRPDGSVAGLKIASKDEDVVFRARSIVGTSYSVSGGCYNGCYMYNYQVYGTLAIQWMMTLLPLMGNRRRQKIIDCLTFWKARPRYIPRKDKLVLGGVCRSGHHLVGANVKVVKFWGVESIKCKICITGSTRARDRAYKERLLALQPQEVSHSS